jgi:hypothetical protein
VRGRVMESGRFSALFHPHPNPPPSRGRECFRRFARSSFEIFSRLHNLVKDGG